MRMDEPVSMSKRADQPLPILKGPTFTARLAQIFHGELPIEPLEGSKYKRILIPGLTGGELHFSILGFIAQALRIRGADVTALMCDEVLPACTLRKADHVESACTRWCHRNSPCFAEAMNLPHRWYSAFLSDKHKRDCQAFAAGWSLNDLPSLEYRGIALGELVIVSLESYFKVGGVDWRKPEVTRKAHDFLLAALYLTEISLRALKELRIDKVLLDDGKKTDWGVMRAAARHLGIPVDVINIGIRGTSVRFTLDRPGCSAASMPGWDRWQHQPLTDVEEQQLDAYLLRRECVPYEYSQEMWNTAPVSSVQARQQLKLPAAIDGKVFAMFPNLGFDAGKTRSGAVAFTSPAEWVITTAEIFRDHPQHHLILKAHPAEHHRQASDSILQILRESVDVLPANIHLVEATSHLTAKSIVELADIVIVYTSTVAVEAAAIGKPVVLVGGGWNAGRGIATDVTSPQQYFDLLEQIMSGRYTPPASETIGRRYAYSLFFRNDIPINHFCMEDFHISAITIDSAAELCPGVDPSMDVICRGILFDEPFENPETRPYDPMSVATELSHQL